MKLKVFRKDLNLKHVTMTSAGSVSVVRSVIVELEQDGVAGFGESYEDRAIHPMRADAMREKIERLAPAVRDYALADPTAFDRFIAPLFQDDAASRCAVEMAACDLWGKIFGCPLRRLWKYRGSGPFYSSFTIGQDSPERAVEKFEENSDWPIYRVELGGRNDIPLLESIRQRTDARLYVDAAGSWSLSQALDYLPHLVSLGVELIEQPLPPDRWEEAKIFKSHSPIPVYADESCLSIEDVSRCVGAFDGVNLRPVKFGGLLGTRRAIAAAKAFGLKTMIGSPVETAVGASAVSQFVPVLDAFYIDGPQQIDRRIGQGVELDRGRVCFSRLSGTGVTFVKTQARMA